MLPVHPAADIFPPMGVDDFRALVEDIRLYGQREPITLWRGQVIDGRHRLRACVELERAPITRTWDGPEGGIVAYVISCNLHRRHLNESQRAMVAARIATLGEGRPEKTAQGCAVSQTGAAALLNVSRRSVQSARQVIERAPDLAPAVERGEITVTEAARQIKERQREQRRDENRAIVASAPSPSAVAKGARFATIVIDPPWDYREEGDDDVYGHARPTYSQMSDDQIAALPVAELADDDCHLYLWITNRSLLTGKGWRLAEAWGFRPVTVLTWCKPSIGVGNYFRNNTEHLVFAVKGSQSLKRRDVGTWFEAPRGPKGHSSKPDASYALIEACSPGPYLEMFSRHQREGWVAWGEESARVSA